MAPKEIEFENQNTRRASLLADHLLEEWGIAGALHFRQFRYTLYHINALYDLPDNEIRVVQKLRRAQCDGEASAVGIRLSPHFLYLDQFAIISHHLIPDLSAHVILGSKAVFETPKADKSFCDESRIVIDRSSLVKISIESTDQLTVEFRQQPQQLCSELRKHAKVSFCSVRAGQYAEKSRSQNHSFNKKVSRTDTSK